MRRLYCILTCLLLAALPLGAVPAKPGVLRHTQPDGSVVEYRIRGDEFCHWMETVDGCAVALDESTRALCYAFYDASGAKRSSGVAVGAAGSEAARAASRAIPVDRLMRARAQRRRDTGPAEPRVRTRAESSSARAIVLLAQFPDLSFRFSRDYFQDLLTKKNYNYEEASGSVLDYFDAQFRGASEFTFDLGPVVTLSRGYAYYGEDDANGNDLRAHIAAAEACQLSDPAVDFSQYDFIYVFYAGGTPADGGASDDHIWPHAWKFQTAGIRLVLDGKQLNDYAMSSELMNVGTGTPALSGIGTFCHEFSHILGLYDLYDVDNEKSGGKTDGMWGSLSLMDAGNYNNYGRTPPNYSAMELLLLGLLDPEPLTVGSVSLEPMTTRRRALRYDTDTENEFFLFECRASVGWDRYIGGSGLLVYHCDASGRDAGYSEYYEMNLTARQRWLLNEVNTRPDHPCARIITANPNPSEVSQVFYPYSTRTYLSPSSDPPFRFWSGETAAYSLVGMKKSGGVVSFSVNGPIAIDVEDVMQDAAIFNWSTEVESCKSLSTLVRWTDASGRTVERTVAPYEPGKYALTLEGLTPGGSYTLSLCYLVDGEELYPVSQSFTTARYGGLPYIRMTAARRNSGLTVKNRIPLRVMNAQGATGVEWSLNGRDIAVGDDGYYEIRSAGTLRAVVHYSDGTREVIVREVSVK